MNRFQDNHYHHHSFEIGYRAPRENHFRKSNRKKNTKFIDDEAIMY